MHNHLLVAILAAGASRRLGQPKQLVEINGQPLLRRQCRVAFDARIGPVFVVLGCQRQECAQTLANLNVSILLNEQWQEGMASSIRVAARRAIEQSAGGLLIVQCDQYRIAPEDLQTMHQTWAVGRGMVACRSRHQDYIGPPVIFPRRCFEALLQLKGENGARSVLRQLAKDAIVDVNLPNAIHDLDIPSQLGEIVQTKSKRGITTSS